MVPHREPPRAPPRRGRGRRLRPFAEGALLALGVLALLLYAKGELERRHAQHVAETRFAELRAQLQQRDGDGAAAPLRTAGPAAPVPDMRDWSDSRRRAWHEARGAERGAALGRLVLPAADLEAMVLAGIDDDTLDRGVGRVPGTALEGNLGIAGHRDGFFRRLRHVEVGDRVRLELPDAVHIYRVRALWKVSPDAVGVLAPTDAPALTLVTCFPFWYVGSAPERYVVRAERVATRKVGAAATRDEPGAPRAGAAVEAATR